MRTSYCFASSQAWSSWSSLTLVMSFKSEGFTGGFLFRFGLFLQYSVWDSGAVDWVVGSKSSSWLVWTLLGFLPRALGLLVGLLRRRGSWGSSLNLLSADWLKSDRTAECSRLLLRRFRFLLLVFLLLPPLYWSAIYRDLSISFWNRSLRLSSFSLISALRLPLSSSMNSSSFCKSNNKSKLCLLLRAYLEVCLSCF